MKGAAALEQQQQSTTSTAHWREGTTSIAGSLASRKETRASKTCLGLDAPSPSTTPSLSTPSKRMRKLTPQTCYKTWVAQ
ncbi:unnamed protein product [Haemonchus placei]|uniref:Uncharacterized protein n=1 Tax=Haemonchus placei TaxID=6290 RepID=A0A0N4WGL1_HAEPC|nr:unnamed protein product [Haemonchus placei]